MSSSSLGKGLALLYRLRPAIVSVQTATETTAAKSAIWPLDNAATTFCWAAIATTTGIYMVPQNETPFSVSTVIIPRFSIHNRIQMSKIMAIPTPPTLDFTPNKTPNRSPAITPTKVQSASKPTPYIIMTIPHILGSFMLL
ncbi:malonate transporter [Acinetobacter baumannii NCGM 237]|nr:malonate transporter [Acinetobacter baumannii NCGM 237]